MDIREISGKIRTKAVQSESTFEYIHIQLVVGLNTLVQAGLDRVGNKPTSSDVAH